MVIATDALSLVFIGCFVVSGAFLILSSVLGFGHGHFHLGHIGHASPAAGHGVGHASAVLHHALPPGHAGAQTTNAQQAAGSQGGLTLWATLANALNLYAILTFLFWFGLIGYILHNLTNLGSLSAFMGALLVGLVGADVVFTPHGVGEGCGRGYAAADRDPRAGPARH